MGRPAAVPGGPPSSNAEPCPPCPCRFRLRASSGADDPQSILHEVFGYAQFRGPQEAIVDHVVGGGDALVLMPTGGGKSLCYQIPAIARQRAGHGVTIVVSPLIALMHDQVGALHEAGVERGLPQFHARLGRRRRTSSAACCAARSRCSTPRPSA